MCNTVVIGFSRPGFDHYPTLHRLSTGVLLCEFYLCFAAKIPRPGCCAYEEFKWEAVMRYSMLVGEAVQHQER